MILYLDASALVKRYVAEPGSAEVSQVISQAEVVGTALISRAEVAAALAKAVRLGALLSAGAWASLQAFRSEWLDLMRIQVSELTVTRADAYAWEFGLRGYDAVHLAAAAVWQDALGEPVTLATFDRPLWTTAGRVGLAATPAAARRAVLAQPGAAGPRQSGRPDNTAPLAAFPGAYPAGRVAISKAIPKICAPTWFLVA
ncbi:MAG: type II toxin-antitoxin system VapC family toxin [Chloroflexota bacterium]